MKTAILDTNFILSSIREKIDFFEDLYLRGIEVVIPEEVILEIEKIKDSKKKLRFKEEAKFAMKVLDGGNFKKIKIGKGRVDKRLIEYATSHPYVLIATLDKEIKEKIKNHKIVIRGKKKLEIV